MSPMANRRFCVLLVMMQFYLTCSSVMRSIFARCLPQLRRTCLTGADGCSVCSLATGVAGACTTAAPDSRAACSQMSFLAKQSTQMQ